MERSSDTIRYEHEINTITQGISWAVGEWLILWNRNGRMTGKMTRDCRVKQVNGWNRSTKRHQFTKTSGSCEKKGCGAMSQNTIGLYYKNIKKV
jgi:hypothetical protein